VSEEKAASLQPKPAPRPEPIYAIGSHKYAAQQERLRLSPWNRARTRMSERPKQTFLAEIAREELQERPIVRILDWHLLVSR
jgi:hypothetical protein